MNAEFLTELNEQQREAVEYTEGASLVIAGAGSGKTRVLTYKIAYLIKRGHAPSSIMALTFTNKAAREMKERIAQLVGEQQARYLWMGTFHSIFSKILRTEAEKIGYSKNFTIYDTTDSKSLIKSIVKELKLDEKTYKPSLVLSRISNAKNNLITADAYITRPEFFKSDNAARIPFIKEIYQLYSQRCKQADAMDFDDLLLQTNLLFRNHPEVLAEYQQRFSYILVDEYQDTNFAQYLIVKKLAEKHEKICVVGDDAQSIYSFRGANIDNILQFKSTYNNSRIFKLEQNYRSTQTIVNAANSLITKNSRQIPKTIFSDKETGKPIKILSVSTDYEEGFVVASSISRLHLASKYNYHNMAILYRTNSQSRVMEEALRKDGIPYRIYGGLSFYQRKEIKDLIAYFRFSSNHNDEEALKRIINYPARGIGDTTVNKIFACAQLHQTTAWEVITRPLDYNLSVNSGTANKLNQFCNLIQSFAEQAQTLNAYEVANSIVRVTGIIADTYTDRSPEALSRQENVQELLKAIHEFCETKEQEENIRYLPDFLSDVSLLTDQDTDKDTDKDKVTLMTVHAAKGLEFKVIFIVGMEEELFPSAFTTQSENDLEEERRLFYVAVTRAEERCFISYAKSRFRNGKTNFSKPSRFIRDIDEQYLDQPEEERLRQTSAKSWDDELSFERKRYNEPYTKTEIPAYEEPRTIPKRLVKIHGNSTEEPQLSSPSSLTEGSFVKHAVFGIGKVVGTDFLGGNERAEIDFGEKGTKLLLLKFAKLDVLK